jgi:F-type H+-transporting ATPase subunit b
MLIDWFTVVAQIINFLILLVLLHRFLYKPILKTIDKRQDQMAARWHAAEAAQEKARAEAQKHRQAQQTLEEQREQLLAEARSTAQTVHYTELQKAREAIAQKRREWQNALDHEQQTIMADLQHQFGLQMVAIIRRVLQDLANADLEQQAIQTFQHKLQNLDTDTRQAMAAAFADQDQPITVQTALELPAESQAALRQTLQDSQLLNGHPIRFDVSPELIFGIRLQNKAYDLAWSAEDYLEDLERTLRQHLPLVASQPPQAPEPEAAD